MPIRVLRLIFCCQPALEMVKRGCCRPPRGSANRLTTGEGSGTLPMLS